MRKRVVLIQILVFSVCIVASTILLVVPRQQHHMAGSDIATKKEYGWPLTWRSVAPSSETNASSTKSTNTATALNSEKLIINLLIFGSVTTFLLLATSALEKHT